MDYKKTGWFCGQNTMEPVSTWYRCTSCWATFVEQPSLGEYMDLGKERNPQNGKMKYKPRLRRGRVKGGPALKPLLRPTDKGYGKAHR